MKEHQYPYEVRKGQCKTNEDSIHWGKIQEIGEVEPEERYLQKGVYKKESTTIAID